ncbi:MAG: hypothetical protein M4579_004300 [Chaenotheca gracillima]|nr:MAG: hypothetical protein M4579_004300 [Chaenotheca gracillima]
MADTKRATNGPSPYAPEGYDSSTLPDYDHDFVDEADMEEFARALAAPENALDESSSGAQPSGLFITALNDWRPIHQRVRGRRKGTGARKRRPPRRGTDETREGFVYTLLKWPLLLLVLAWIIALGATYFVTRWYIWFYEHYVTWRGKRQTFRRDLQSTTNYADWIHAAENLDRYLGNEEWKENNEYAYYDHGTVSRAKDQMRDARMKAEAALKEDKHGGADGQQAIDELRSLLEATVKNNFVGVENPRLYSQTYYGTKNLVQAFVDEVEASLSFLSNSDRLSQDEKRSFFQHTDRNYGRTALCLSGGACFAYYHFGVVKALLDANLLPEVITGTSGGALVAALIATRTDDELKLLLVPALAGRIRACNDDFTTWVRRWYRTGARFDSIEWAKACNWFTRGSMTFREAYERTGRILNVSCVPSDPHSPTILANYLTSPDCVIWSAVMASAAVPGILNPVVLMMKKKDGRLAPYSFGHKWKDGSLRTDIPLKALNLHFNVNFSIVSQVNPHINLFFFSSRGSVGRPVTHRRGRGWRGGFLGSAVEQYIKLDLNKWLKVLRHLELLPRPLGQDWSEVWLQHFSGTITIWPKSVMSDFYYILSDPTPPRLARMLQVGQQSTFPKLKFIANRMKIERLVEKGRRATGISETQISQSKLGQQAEPPAKELRTVLSEEDLEGLLREVRRTKTPVLAPSPAPSPKLSTSTAQLAASNSGNASPSSPSIGHRLSGWWSSFQSRPGDGHRRSLDSAATDFGDSSQSGAIKRPGRPRRGSRTGSVISEIGRQSRVFFDDSEVDDTEGSAVEDTELSGTEGDLDDHEHDQDPNDSEGLLIGGGSSDQHAVSSGNGKVTQRVPNEEGGHQDD